MTAELPEIHFKYPTEQSDPPLSPRQTLPTMYDLPSEDPEEPGLPDEFHDFQPELLRLTFRPPDYYPDRLFCGSDMNLYYDVHHQSWYKRPDWFGIVGVSRFYDDRDLRLSYVVWQEGVTPFVVVELLSPGTEDEDLGRRDRAIDRPPTKWEVYEQILRVPYYVVFSRYSDRLRVFALQAGRYRELELDRSRVWMPEIALGLGLWQGEYQGRDRLWLRWYDERGNWILTDSETAREQAERERQRAEAAEARAARLEQRLRELGIELDE